MDSIFKEQAKWLLHSINYHSLPIENDNESVSINFAPVDNMQIIKRNLKEIAIIIRRTLKIEPVEVFSICIEMQVLVEFVDGANTAELSDDYIIQAFKTNCAGLVDIMMSKISLLISEITGSGQLPIVTQPHFMEIEGSK